MPLAPLTRCHQARASLTTVGNPHPQAAPREDPREGPPRPQKETPNPTTPAASYLTWHQAPSRRTWTGSTYPSTDNAATFAPSSTTPLSFQTETLWT